jgi:hypothetical protein
LFLVFLFDWAFSFLDGAAHVLCLIRCLLKVSNPYDEDMIDTEGSLKPVCMLLLVKKSTIKISSKGMVIHISRNLGDGKTTASGNDRFLEHRVS